MALQFNPGPYLDVWQRNNQIQDQNRIDPNTAISQPLLQGLQQMADAKRQQQLLDLQKQTLAAQNQKDAYEYGTPIDPNATVGSATGQMGSSVFMPGAPAPGTAGPMPAQPVGTGMKLVDAFNAWRAGGMKGPAQPEFMGALGKDERAQLFKQQNEDETNYVAPQYDAAGNVTGWTALPKGTKPASIPRPYNSTGVTTANLNWNTATPAQQNMAIAMVKGNIRPSDLGLRDRATIVGLANEYAQKNNMPFQSYGGEVKAKTANYFASGKGGQNATSLNTALGHLSDALDSYNAVGNTNQQWLNVPLNKLRTMTDNPDVVALNLNLNALRGELANVFKNGGGTDQEIASWSNYLNDNLTPAQFQAAAQKVNGLLNSRLDALNYQQNDVMKGGGPERSFLSPHGASIAGKLSSGSPTGANEVQRRTNDGRIAVFDANTKQFLRYAQ